MKKLFNKIYDSNPMLFTILFSLLFFYGIGSIISFIKGENKNNESEVEEYVPLTPRHMKGLDTVRAHDSLYIIKFEIQKVMPDTIPNESQDKYEDDY